MATAQTSGLGHSRFSRESGFPSESIRLLLVIPSERLLGLGSKLYPSNMPRMLKKDLTPFTQSLSRVRQNRTSERKAVLAG